MGRTGRLVALLLVVVPATVFVLVVAAEPARAVFPGRNGLLVVEPAGGRGLVVVGQTVRTLAGFARLRRDVMGHTIQCGRPTDPKLHLPRPSRS